MADQNSKKKDSRGRRRQLRIIFTCLLLLAAAIGLLIYGFFRLQSSRTPDPARAARMEKISQEESAIKARRNTIAKAKQLASGYDYDAAIALLQQEDNYTSDSELVNAIAAFTADKAALETKDPTTVPHIFFHSLIVDTSRAFDTSKWSTREINGINAWMTTVDEFDKMIQQLYDNGYVLVKARDLVTEYKGEDGYVHFKKSSSLRLPPDKKPLVLSVDDWSYYHTYTGKGFSDKAVLDSQGNVKVQYTDADGNASVGDYDVVPRLNTFIASHPDFSYKGARGLIAMTGYNGVFGYRTDTAYRTGENLDEDQKKWLEEHPDFSWDQDVADAKKIADAVKKEGWEFACHTWGHLSVTGKSVETLKTDQEKWQATVANITGQTDTIIFAHGNDIGNWKPYDMSTNPVFAYYKNAGYNYYMNVDASQKHWVQINDLSFRQGRIDCDGLQMWRALSGSAKINVFEDLFDVKSVFSSARPTPVTAEGKA